jgi:hypothetical protein
LRHIGVGQAHVRHRVRIHFGGTLDRIAARTPRQRIVRLRAEQIAAPVVVQKQSIHSTAIEGAQHDVAHDPLAEHRPVAVIEHVLSAGMFRAAVAVGVPTARSVGIWIGCRGDLRRLQLIVIERAAVGPVFRSARRNVVPPFLARIESQEEARVGWIDQLVPNRREPRQRLDDVPVHEHARGAGQLGRSGLPGEQLLAVHRLGLRPDRLGVAPVVAHDPKLRRPTGRAESGSVRLHRDQACAHPVRGRPRRIPGLCHVGGVCVRCIRWRMEADHRRQRRRRRVPATPPQPGGGDDDKGDGNGGDDGAMPPPLGSVTARQGRSSQPHPPLLLHLLPVVVE